MGKIRLLAVDVDGCMTRGEGQPVDLDILRRVQDFNNMSKSDKTVPAVTLCTGRQQPFVDLMCQTIGAYTPAIFENGGGLYVPETYSFIFHPSITPELKERIFDFKRLVEKKMVSKRIAKIQPGKEVSLSIYPCEGCSMDDLRRQLEELLDEFGSDLYLDISTMCINVLVPGITKGSGIEMLAGYLKMDPMEMGAVGDMPGDLYSLRAVGFAACPANAVEEVKKIAHFVAPHENGRGVLSIIEEAVRRNRA